MTNDEAVVCLMAACGLTAAQARLALELYRARSVLSRNDLVERLCPEGATENLIAVQVGLIRKRLGDLSILTIRGVGYQMHPMTKAEIKRKLDAPVDGVGSAIWWAERGYA